MVFQFGPLALFEVNLGHELVHQLCFAMPVPGSLTATTLIPRQEQSQGGLTLRCVP
jgi:hypothetical protein